MRLVRTPISGMVRLTGSATGRPGASEASGATEPSGVGMTEAGADRGDSPGRPPDSSTRPAAPAATTSRPKADAAAANGRRVHLRGGGRPVPCWPRTAGLAGAAGLPVSGSPAPGWLSLSTPVYCPDARLPTV